MTLFDQKKDHKLTKQDVYFNMAEEILENLGTSVTRYEHHHLYKDFLYEKDGLTIIMPDSKRKFRSGLYVTYKNQEVLSQYRFLKGDWRNALRDIYIELPELMKQKESKNCKENSEMLYQLNLLTSFTNDNFVIINKDLRVYKMRITTGDYSFCYQGTFFQVYDKNLKVFDAYDGGMPSRNKYDTYIPGEWENEIKEYLKEKMAEKNLKKTR